MYPFFMAVACCVGDFDEGEGSGDCFGEVWSKSTDSNGDPIAELAVLSQAYFKAGLLQWKARMK